MEKFDFNYVINYFHRNGYSVFTEKYENCDTKIGVEDKEEYKYFISYHILYSGILRNDKYIPKRFSIQNPYTINNIINYLYINSRSIKFIDGIYEGSFRDNLIFKCSNCNKDFNFSWTCVYMGQNCPYCAGKRVIFENSLAYARTDLIEEWDYEKNYPLTPKDVSSRSSKVFWWKCKDCNYNWKTSVSNRNAGKRRLGSNCPKCNKSNGELVIENFLNNYEITYISQKRFDDCRYKIPLPFDFYLSDYQICIEYQGQQHYKPTQFNGCSGNRANNNFNLRIIKDQIKRKYCENNNIKLLEIPYWDFPNIEEILTNELLNNIKIFDYKEVISYVV